MKYTSGDLIQRFNCTHETIRSWATEFRRHLSPDANPGLGKHRRFSFDDLEVLTLVHEMREQKHTWEEIHAALEAGERGTPNIDPTALVSLESLREIDRLHHTIERLKVEVVELQAQLNAANTRADRAEGAQRSLIEQLAEAQETIIQLRIEAARTTSDGRGRFTIIA